MKHDTKALSILIDRYTRAKEINTLKDLIADINQGLYRQRHDYKQAISEISLQEHQGRLGAPLKSNVNKPGIFSYTHEKTDDFADECERPRISIREITKKAKYYDRFNFNQIKGWNKMKPIQKVQAILEADIDAQIKKDLIQPLLKEIQ